MEANVHLQPILFDHRKTHRKAIVSDLDDGKTVCTLCVGVEFARGDHRSSAVNDFHRIDARHTDRCGNFNSVETPEPGRAHRRPNREGEGNVFGHLNLAREDLAH